MKRTFLSLIIVLLFSSCVTVLNNGFTVSTIYTTKPTKIIYKNDTVSTEKNKVEMCFARKKAPIQFTVITDSLRKRVTVNPINSRAYWANIPYTCGVGILIDMKNPKRYSYPKRIYLNSSDTINKHYSYEQEDKKGQVLLHLSLPYINNFYLTPVNEITKYNFGYSGVSIGLDYYHKRNQYVNVSASGVADSFAPMGPIDLIGEYEQMSSTYLSLSNNHNIKRFSLGYGLSFAKNTWDFRNYGGYDIVPTREPVKKSNNALGLVFSSYYQATPHFYIGVIYRPTFFRLDTAPTFKYEHLVSIDFAWKIRLKK